MTAVKTVSLLAVVVVSFTAARTLDDAGNTLDDYFKNCRSNSSDFDKCVMGGLNSARSFFKTGVAEYGVLPFDPFFAAEVVQKRGRPAANYRLTLRDVYEHGWSRSLVTSFKSDLPTRTIKYSQWFPEKYLEGRYEMEGHLLRYPMTNKGFFNLTLYNYTQTTTVRRPDSGPMAVKVRAQTAADMKIHVSNLLRGRPVAEGVLGRIINVSWAPGFAVLKPAIDDLVSSAFTAIFSEDFDKFPFREVFSA